MGHRAYIKGFRVPLKRFIRERERYAGFRFSLKGYIRVMRGI